VIHPDLLLLYMSRDASASSQWREPSLREAAPILTQLIGTNKLVHDLYHSLSLRVLELILCWLFSLIDLADRLDDIGLMRSVSEDKWGKGCPVRH
jgi:hypothetical protein